MLTFETASYMNAITITKLYELLVPKIGKEAAEYLTTFIDSKISTELENSTRNLATKEDLANVKSEITRWMFVFWISQLASMIGIILLFVRK
jgi:hypothetical protein